MIEIRKAIPLFNCRPQEVGVEYFRIEEKKVRIRIYCGECHREVDLPSLHFGTSGVDSITVSNGIGTLPTIEFVMKNGEVFEAYTIYQRDSKNAWIKDPAWYTQW